MVSVSENFNFGWQFYKSPDTASLPSPTAKWITVNLPHTANLEQLTVKDQWQGICFYSKSFKVDKQYRGKAISIQFDAAMNVADVWVNGKKTHHTGRILTFCHRPFGYCSFRYIKHHIGKT
jgi:beta-galactosidase